MPFNYILFILYILYPRCYIYCVYRYILITYVNIRIYRHSRPERRAPGAPRTRSPKPEPGARNAPRSPHKRHISPPILIDHAPPQPSTRRTTEFYTAVQLPPPFYIYKYPRYILYILKIYNICVYIMCIYISIGIYKISAAKKRANRTQKEYTHTAKARRRAIPQRRERTPPREARTQKHSTQRAADCRITLIQFFRRGSVADSRLFTISGAFARFCEFSKTPRKPPSAQPRPSNSSHLCNNGQR